jgi:CAAX prenyl protease-like protein
MQATARAVPFLTFVAVLALRSVFNGDAPSLAIIDLRWLYALQAALAAVALLAWRHSYVELRDPPRPASALLWTLLLGIAVFFLWILPMPNWLRMGGSSANFVPVDAQGDLRWELIVVRTMGAVLVVPVMEELFWRSFLMRWIDQRDFLALAPERTSWLSVLVSSVVFCLGHDLWAAAFVAGIVYALLYRRTGNLWYPVLAHATTNLALAVWVVSRQDWSYW